MRTQQPSTVSCDVMCGCLSMSTVLHLCTNAVGSPYPHSLSARFLPPSLLCRLEHPGHHRELENKAKELNAHVEHVEEILD